MLRGVLFDLDGTLLPVDQDTFTNTYFSLLAEKMSTYGYEPKLFMDTLLKALYEEIANDGSRTNMEVFWHIFTSVFGEGSRKDEAIFDSFYRNEFQKVKGVCHPSPKAKEIVDMLNAKGVKVILATNPFFPKVATESRIGWAGLEPDDFIIWTTYEDSCYCKPNPDYFRDLMKRTGLDVKDCIMVGNDVDEDILAARSAGMRAFLLDLHVVNKRGRDLSDIPKGDFDDLIEYLKKEIES